MDNYVYIVAGLPELNLAFEPSDFSYEKVRDYFYSSLSEKDRKTVDLLEEGHDDEALGIDFYRKALAHPNRFIREYFRFDLHSRNMKVNYLSKRLNQPGEKYIIDIDDSFFEEEKQVQSILDNPDFIQREQQMDSLAWEKASELTCTEYFSLNVILAFLVKAKIIERWSIMDKKRGEDLFSKLVTEVRGTFKGLKESQEKGK